MLTKQKGLIYMDKKKNKMAGILDWGVLFKWIETKDLTITAVGTKKKQVYIFSYHGLLCASFVEHGGEIILELKHRLAVQLKSHC